MKEYLEIRCSALSRYADCPRSAAARLFKDELKGYALAQAHNSASASIGNAVHYMMGDLFKQKMEYGSMDIDQAIANAEPKFLESLSSETIWDPTTPSITTARAQVKSLCRAFLPIAQMITPIEAEVQREHWVNPLGALSIPVKLTGSLDVCDNKFEIHDHKTGKNFPKPHAQLGGYAILREIEDLEVRAVRVNFAPRLGIRSVHEIPDKMRSVRFDLEECKLAAWNVIREIQKHYEDFASRRHANDDSPEWAFPANPYSQICTAKYCSAFGTPWCKVGFCG
jgi:hypothetical protein